jgi:hypothetical protein
VPQAAGQVFAPARNFALPRVRGGITTPALVMAWLVLTVGAGFRLFGVGVDYFNYVAYYDYIPEIFSFEDTRFEPGFHLAAWFFRHKIGLSFDQFTMLIVAISLAIKFYLFRKYLAHPLLAVVAYFLIFYGIHEYTQIRAALALALGYWAIHLVMERRWIWAVLLFAVSLTFHTSAILLLPAFIGAQFIRGTLSAVLLGVGAAVLFALSEYLYQFAIIYFATINPLLQGYLDNATTDINSLSLGSINNLMYMAALAAAVVFRWFDLGRYHSTFLTMAILSLVMLALFAASPIVGQRAKEVLFVASIFVMFRAPLSARTFVPVALFFAMGALLFYLELRASILVF